MKQYLNAKSIAGFLGLFLITAGVSWAIFSLIGGGSIDQSPEGLAAERARLEGLPKTAECPINGEYFTEVEREIWESRRPLTAMIENHPEARPLEGLSQADVVYESTVEGGATRNLAVFYCDAASHNVRMAPIRSARVNFIKWAGGYGDKPIYMHIGGANNFCNNPEQCPNHPFKLPGTIDSRVDAYALLGELGWNQGQSGNDFNVETNIGWPVGRREPGRLSSVGVNDLAKEHQVVAFSDEAYTEAANRGFAYVGPDGTPWDESFRSWTFADDAPLSSPVASEISFGFWSNRPDYDVVWEYDQENNQYLRSNGGDETYDLSNEDARVTAKNVIVIFVDQEAIVDEEGHNYDEVYGQGEAIVFQNGDAIEGTWEKADFEDRLVFYGNDGQELSIVRGKVWIEGLPTGGDVAYN